MKRSLEPWPITTPACISARVQNGESRAKRGTTFCGLHRYACRRRFVAKHSYPSILFLYIYFIERMNGSVPTLFFNKENPTLFFHYLS